MQYFQRCPMILRLKVDSPKLYYIFSFPSSFLLSSYKGPSVKGTIMTIQELKKMLGTVKCNEEKLFCIFDWVQEKLVMLLMAWKKLDIVCVLSWIQMKDKTNNAKFQRYKMQFILFFSNLKAGAMVIVAGECNYRSFSFKDQQYLSPALFLHIMSVSLFFGKTVLKSHMVFQEIRARMLKDNFSEMFCKGVADSFC